MNFVLRFARGPYVVATVPYVGHSGLSVTFYGVRGSTPCSGPDTMAFGGNTSCVAVESSSSAPILLDLGTGLRYFGRGMAADGSFRGSALVSHLHWDHIQGLPFFAPVLCNGSQLDLYGPPPSDGVSLEEAFERFMTDPFFPVRLSELPGRVTFNALDDGTIVLDGITVTTRSVPHIGRTNGYRLESGGCSLAYIPDHQQPIGTDVFSATQGVIDLCDGVDLLIHDAQFTAAEFLRKSTWGHCSIEYACWVAKESGARRLALFHHDPAHCDEELAALIHEAERWGEREGVEVIGATEGMRLMVGNPT